MTLRDDRAVEAWAALLQAHARLVPELDRVLRAEADLPLTHYDVLLELAAAPPEGLRMGDLGERAVVSRTRVSRVVDVLAEAGLVSRRADPGDLRSARAVLTDLGRERLARAEPVYLQAIRDRFAAELTTDQLTAVRDALSIAARTDGRVRFTTRKPSDPAPR